MRAKAFSSEEEAGSRQKSAPNRESRTLFRFNRNGTGFRGPIAYIALYAALYAAFGVASPFWPKYFETRALNPEQIGVILATALLVRLVAGPLVGTLADFLQSLRLVLAACATLAAASAAALLWADGFWLLLLVASVQAAALAPTTSIADALSVNASRPQMAGRPFEYGWIRGSASAAFVCGTLIIGQLVSPTDLSRVIWLNAALLIAAAGATALVPAVAAQSTPHTGASNVASEIRTLLGIARFRILILVSALIYGSHAVHDAFAVIRWSNAGIDTFVVSMLWSEAVAAEVIVFVLVGPALLNRFGARDAAALAAVAGIVRWSIAATTNSVVALAMVQPLHGLTFALLHLACMRMIGSLVPAHLAATAQALYAFGAGAVTAALTLFSGFFYAGYGGGAFLAMAVLCGVALPLAWSGFADTRESSSHAA
ncbi:MFS transporter [Bradyrhizobium archetypum]|uniref:MFS transporter n=1 Tax=Bradyrhizobium archetypum TaxID=2721160 RepID=A0A7Y4M3I3_9BRAD|nr:MFS transporter [Bradyrhizobium archetypum]NOJ48823.1 MFS transporter [Bradyrhizobium archetypum]